MNKRQKKKWLKKEHERLDKLIREAIANPWINIQSVDPIDLKFSYYTSILVPIIDGKVSFKYGK